LGSGDSISFGSGFSRSEKCGLSARLLRLAHPAESFAVLDQRHDRARDEGTHQPPEEGSPERSPGFIIAPTFLLSCFLDSSAHAPAAFPVEGMAPGAPPASAPPTRKK
jgi:hypothetical protein